VVTLLVRAKPNKASLYFPYDNGGVRFRPPPYSLGEVRRAVPARARLYIRLTTITNVRDAAHELTDAQRGSGKPGQSVTHAPAGLVSIW
jgi:hypothetical protein